MIIMREGERNLQKGQDLGDRHAEELGLQFGRVHEDDSLHIDGHVIALKNLDRVGPAPAKFVGKEAAFGGQDAEVDIEGDPEGRRVGLGAAGDSEGDVGRPPMVGDVEGGVGEGGGDPFLELLAGIGVDRHDLEEGWGVVVVVVRRRSRRERREARGGEEGVGDEALLDHCGHQLLLVEF